MALGMLFLALIVMFTIVFALQSSQRAEIRTSSKMVPRLAAHYLAESALNLGILKVVELTSAFREAVKRDKAGDSRYLKHFMADITQDRFMIEDHGEFRIIDITLLTEPKKTSDNMVITIVAEGTFQGMVHKVDKTMELSLGSF